MFVARQLQCHKIRSVGQACCRCPLPPLLAACGAPARAARSEANGLVVGQHGAVRSHLIKIKDATYAPR